MIKANSTSRRSPYARFAPLVVATLGLTLTMAPSLRAQDINPHRQIIVQRSPANSGKLVIKSLTHNAAKQPLRAGTTFSVTMTGTPRAQVEIFLIEDGNNVRSLPVQEVSAGVYVASLNVRNQDRLEEGIIIGRLQRQNQVVFRAASEPVVFQSRGGAGGNSSNPRPSPEPENPNTLRPQFTSHQNEDRITTRGFTLRGQTQANAEVSIRVTSSLPVLGGFLDLASGILINQTVRADNQGNFQLQIPPPNNMSRGVRYLIQAAARRGNQTSPTVELTLIQE